MENKKKATFPSEHDFKVSALCDCTGLVASGMGTEEELEAYNEIYNFMQEPICNTKNDGV